MYAILVSKFASESQIIQIIWSQQNDPQDDPIVSKHVAQMSTKRHTMLSYTVVIIHYNYVNSASSVQRQQSKHQDHFRKVRTTVLNVRTDRCICVVSRCF